MKNVSYLSVDAAPYSKSDLIHDDCEDNAGDKSSFKHSNIRVPRDFGIKNIYFPKLVISEAPIDFRPEGKAR
jgi:hypothetical protein